MEPSIEEYEKELYGVKVWDWGSLTWSRKQYWAL